MEGGQGREGSQEETVERRARGPAGPHCLLPVGRGQAGLLLCTPLRPLLGSLPTPLPLQGLGTCWRHPTASHGSAGKGG